MIKDDNYFMKRALLRAKAAARQGEVPIGAVIVKDGEIISSGRNMREKSKNALLHAEIVAIHRACKKLGAWRLSECTLYVTMEPCPMCAGAIINSRIDRVVFGAHDIRFGALGSLVNLNALGFNHSFALSGGVLENEAKELLSGFFKKKRSGGK